MFQKRFKPWFNLQEMNYLLTPYKILFFYCANDTEILLTVHHEVEPVVNLWKEFKHLLIICYVVGTSIYQKQIFQELMD